MKIGKYFLALSLACAFSSYAQDINFKDCRVDYFNAAGERISSVNLNHQEQQILIFTPNADNTFNVLDPSNRESIVEMRFTGFGEEDYPLEINPEAEEIEDYGFEPVEEFMPKRAVGGELVMTPGTRVRIYIDLPEGYHPKVKTYYLFTSNNSEASEPTGDLWSVIAGTRELPVGVSWFNPYVRNLPSMMPVDNPTPIADEKHPHRYWLNFTMPNEPYVVLLNVQRLDTPTLQNTMRDYVSLFISTPWNNDGIFPGQAFWQGETGIAYYIGEMPGSDCYINYIHDVAPSWSIFYNMDEGYLSSGQYVWSNTVWTYAYSIIASCNEILSSIDKAPADDAEQVAIRHFTKAQALTLRAHCYWRLLQVYAPRWCDSRSGEAPCVVLRTSPFEPQEKAVSTMNEVLAQCYADLDLAIEEFTAAGKSFRTHTYEPDLNVAYGVYARVAALKNDWQTVRDMAHKARQGKRIATSEEIFNGYTQYNENEWMWSPSFDQDHNWIFGNAYTFFACNGFGAVNMGYTNSINRDLYKLIPEGDERANWWFTYEKISDAYPQIDHFYEDRIIDSRTGKIIRERIIYAARDWLNAHKPANLADAYPYYEGFYNSTLRDGAQIKFWINGLQGQDGLCQAPYMRATEMYLYEAEACAELCLTSEAQALLMEINVPRNPNYTCHLTGQALIDEVRLYRRIELWGEGFCWFDLKRWNLPMHRTAWKPGDTTSGNIPEDIACDVPATQNNGWRYGIPVRERHVNALITDPVPGETVTTPAATEAPAKLPALRIPTGSNVFTEPIEFCPSMTVH